ncbi:MAG: Xylose isomerase protein barrel [Oscillospiraceae bacterium]|jgi:sugar phosphate isomerase/epimerase|nr:Xylose isomerase protein barrel [Oscillospiraceae bacterium]
MSGFTLCAFADEAGAALDEQISALKDNDIKYLELRGIDGDNVSDITVKQAKEIKKRLDEKQISVWSIGSPIGKIGIKDDFKPHKEQFLHTLEVAHIMDASCIRLFSFYIPANENNAAYYRDEVLERLSFFCTAAKGSGVVLCHENEKDIYGDVAQRCLDIHQQLNELKAVFDPANFIQCGQDVLEAWKLLEPYIHYVHIKDALEDGRVVPAGHGNGNIEQILRNYSHKGGKMLTLEPHLAVFEGLSQLEQENKSVTDTYTYPNQRAAFDCAVEALKRLI